MQQLKYWKINREKEEGSKAGEVTWVYCAPSLADGPGIEAHVATEVHTDNKTQII